MKLIMENWKKYIYLIEKKEFKEDLNTRVALKIARNGLDKVALGLSDEDLYDLVVSVYEEHFDETGEGWDPYDEDLAQIRNVLTPRSDDEYEI